jgi:pimeloyl-ACP methyl ester carboxylesterase/predicted ester cyclase
MHHLHHRGLRLAYELHGDRPDRPALVLVHGWCSNRTEMRPLARALATGHRVLAVDAAGHGDSDVPEDAARVGVAAQADDVIAVCDHVGLTAAVLVGHSSGAAVAVDIAARRPDLTAAVVALDPMLLPPVEVLAGVGPMLEGLQSPAWREVMREVVAAGCAATDDPDLLAAELAIVDRSPQHVVLGVPTGFLGWDAADALRRVAAPLLVVNATGLVDVPRLRDLVPAATVAGTVGVGHLQLVGHPAQAVAMIEDFLRATLGRPPVDNRGPVQALFAALAADDLARLDDLVADDFVDHGAPPGFAAPGPAGYRAVLGTLREALDLRWEVLELVGEGERVMVHVRQRGRHVGEFLGIPPTGAEIDAEAMHVYRVEDNLLREHRAVRDDLTLLRALGVLPAPALAG